MITGSVLEKLEYYKVLDYIAKYCMTENGKNSVLSDKPLPGMQEAVLAGKKVTEAKEILIRSDYPPISYLPDLNDVLSRSKIEGAVLSAKQILDVLNLAENSRKLFQFLKHQEFEHNSLAGITESLFVDKVFEHHIARVFTEAGEIRDDATPRLKEIRIEIREKENSLRKVVGRLLRQFSDAYLVQEEYITLRDGRIVLPVKSEHKRHVRGFIHSESSTGQTVYIEPEETLELNNEILSLSFAEKREIEKILMSLTQKIGESAPELKKSLAAISELDSVFAKAKYSIEIIGSFPSYDEVKPIDLIDGRHPILIKKLGLNNTVPLNIKIENSSVVLITGPNAGGKTVVLKTFGLLAMLAQSGIHIPVNPDSNFRFFENILVDIGDQQSIEDDLSTFSSHLSNIRDIIVSAGKDTLVLLDEIGTGTDPAEGAAIAAGVLVSLRDKKSVVLATTHHGSLKIIAHENEGFQNASMEFDTVELRPTYKFNQGLPGSSYAFEVAGRIGFEDKFLDLAKQFLDSDKMKVEDFLVNLEKKSKHLRDQINKLEIENLRLKSLANLYQEKINNLESQKKNILAEAREKAQIYLNDMNKKFEESVRRIRETNANKEVIKEEKKKIEEIKKTAKEIFREEKESKAPDVLLKAGDYASVKNTTSVGIIAEIDHLKKRATLLVGSIKLQVKLNELLPAKKSEHADQYRKQYDLDNEVLSYKLDIRGKRPHETEFEILKFLDTAYINGVDRVEIVHGKGTGALKQLVKDILKGYDKVKNFYYASIESGGDGITIVEFK